MMKLSDLTKIFIGSLEHSDFPNPDFRSEKLKIKLEKHEYYQSMLAFCSLSSKGKMQSYIVYRSDIELSSAVATAYELGSIDMTKEAGLYLRNVILEHFSKSEVLKWPPTAQDLGSMHDILPE